MRAIPKFIYKKSNQVAMIIAVPIFAFIFITIYRPLDFANIDDSIFGGMNISRELAIQLITLLLVLVGMVVASVSRLVMGAYTRRRELSYVQYIVWISTEILVMALIYTVAALLTETKKDAITLFQNSLTKTLLITIIPYVVCYIIFVWAEQAKQLRLLRTALAHDESAQQMAYVRICDEHDEPRLSVRREDLLFIEAADNYTCVWYRSGEGHKQAMVRNTLKRVAEQLDGTSIVRCHRSYMVNLDHIHVLRREKEGLFAELGNASLPIIPISKSYADTIHRWLHNMQ